MQTKHPNIMKTMSPTSTGFPLWRALKSTHAVGLAVLALAAASTGRAQPLLAPWSTVAKPEIMQPGIAAVTCAVPTHTPAWLPTPPAMAFTFALFDLRTPAVPHLGIPYATAAYDPPTIIPLTAPKLWNPNIYHHPSWTMTNIGNVYGIAIDAQGDMYTTAHGLYAKGSYFGAYGGLGGWPTANPAAAAGTVYRISRLTGVVSVFAVIPNQLPMNLGGFPAFTAGPGLGNIAYNPVNDQFLVTSLEDGKIYRIVRSGVIGIPTPPHYDPSTTPLAPDNGLVGMPPVTDRLWGIGVSRGAVFYAVWNDATSASPGKIRRVPLLGSGAIDTTVGMDVEVLTVPFSCKSYAQFGYVPVADITFSADGTKMVLGERTMDTETSSYNHASRVHIAELSGTTWTVTKTLVVGNGYFPASNGGCGEAYGGVTYGPENGGSEQLIYMTSADMATGAGPHGIYGVRPGDFPPASSPAKAVNAYRIPFDPAYTAATGPDWKGSGGDVEIMPTTGVRCVKIDNKEVECINTNKTYLWQFCITNCWNQGIKHLSFLDLPPGLTISDEIVTLPSVLLPGQGTCLTLYLTNAPGLTNVCFTVGAHTTNFFECCSVTNCLTLAPCCVYLTGEKLTPIFTFPPVANCYNYTFTVKNVTCPPIPIKYMFLVQDPAPPPNCITFTPEVITFNPALQPNQSMTKSVKVCLPPSSLCKAPYYFLASAHNSNLVECCSTRYCLPKASWCHPIDFPHGVDGSVVLAGSTIRVPVIIDRSIVQPRRAIGYDGTNAVASIVDPADGQHDDWFVISNAVAGTHILRAELIDTLGGVWSSEEVTVYVEEEPSPGGGTPAPVLFVPAAALGGGQVRFLLPTEPGVTCHVEYTESLSPANWQVFQTIVGDGTTVTVIDSTTNARQKFFRVRMP